MSKIYNFSLRHAVHETFSHQALSLSDGLENAIGIIKGLFAYSSKQDLQIFENACELMEAMRPSWARHFGDWKKAMQEKSFFSFKVAKVSLKLASSLIDKAVQIALLVNSILPHTLFNRIQAYNKVVFGLNACYELASLVQRIHKIQISETNLYDLSYRVIKLASIVISLAIMISSFSSLLPNALIVPIIELEVLLLGLDFLKNGFVKI